MQVNTSRFGVLEVNPEELLTFPHGIPAFEHLRSFFFCPVPENPAFTWLQAVDDPDVAFLLVDPFLFFPGYEIELSEAVKKELKIKEPQDVLVLATVTIPDGNLSRMTANLAGPLVINRAARLGLQLILEDKKYTTKHRLIA
ncbi:MAG: flagellar assembly factor FliW [Clostridia bacterium]|nr:flagellar assembly factor FliW [Clostridia bacterium]